MAAIIFMLKLEAQWCTHTHIHTATCQIYTNPPFCKACKWGVCLCVCASVCKSASVWKKVDTGGGGGCLAPDRGDLMLMRSVMGKSSEREGNRLGPSITSRLSLSHAVYLSVSCPNPVNLCCDLWSARDSKLPLPPESHTHSSRTPELQSVVHWERWLHTGNIIWLCRFSGRKMRICKRIYWSPEGSLLQRGRCEVKSTMKIILVQRWNMHLICFINKTREPLLKLSANLVKRRHSTMIFNPTNK